MSFPFKEMLNIDLLYIVSGFVVFLGHPALAQSARQLWHISPISTVRKNQNFSGHRGLRKLSLSNNPILSGLRRTYRIVHEYIIEYCFICRPADSTGSEDAGIYPRTIATLALAVKLL